MQLGIEERLILLNELPSTGNYLTLKLVREMREKLSFSEEEHNEFKFQVKGEGKEQMISWENEKPKDLTFGEKQTDIIKDTLKKLNDANKLQDKQLSLYEKFMIEDK